MIKERQFIIGMISFFALFNKFIAQKITSEMSKKENCEKIIPIELIKLTKHVMKGRCIAFEKEYFIIFKHFSKHNTNNASKKITNKRIFDF